MPSGRASRCRTTATTSQPGDTVLLIVEDDPHYARDPASTSRATRASRCSSRCAAPRRSTLAREYRPTAVSLDVFLPDMLGLDRAQPAEAGPGDAPHPGADRHARRGPPARPGARRVLVRHQAGHHRGPARRRSRGSRTTPQPRRKRLLVVEDNAAEQLSIARAARPRRHRHRRRPTRAPRRSPRCARSRSTASCSTCGCRTCRASRCWSRSATTRRCRDAAGRGVHRPRAVAGGGRAAAHARAQRRRQGRRVARAAARRDRAVPAPRRRRPAAREAADARAAAPLRRGPGRQARCWSSTTTCATSSR